MEGYPEHAVGHNLPFVILFGLRSSNQTSESTIIKESSDERHIERIYPFYQENGIYISSDLPNIHDAAARELLICFEEFDAKEAAWNNRPGKGKLGGAGFTYRSVGRALTLPPHKASAPDLSELETGDDGVRRPTAPPILHSPLSPLTPFSPAYPDGILPSLWFTKHQSLLPSAIIAFFNFTLDKNSSTLHDNKLKSEINALKSSVAASNYKTRLAVVLVSEYNGTESNSAERVGNIRRGTSMDAKSLFHLPRDLSSMEKKAFIGTVLASIQPTCVDYYREMTRHSQRKRKRGTIPPPTAAPTAGTSQTLGIHGWTTRYETKLGFFAESRQDMIEACKHYESAYELLMDQDVFESISSWSPRFSEARILSDILVIRILRCLLWTGQTTAAAQSWENHRARMQDIIERKGKGSKTYGWKSWEARWSMAMAELIEKVDVPIFHVPDALVQVDTQSADVPDVYAIPEKAYATDVLTPWELLHHEAYWLRKSAKHTRDRRNEARMIPREDRYPPEQSPASAVANRGRSYDTYLCPEPHLEYSLEDGKSFNHGKLIIGTLLKASKHFGLRHQRRAVERVEFEIALEDMRAKRWEDAMNRMKPLWKNLSWRRAGWWDLVKEVSWNMRSCARDQEDGDVLIAVEYELLSSFLPPSPNWKYDLANCLEGTDILDKPHAVVEADDLAPTFSAVLSFGSAVSRVGEVLSVQLMIASHARRGSAPVTFSNVSTYFQNGLQQVNIDHDHESEERSSSSGSGLLRLLDLRLDEASTSEDDSLANLSSAFGNANLTFLPGERKIFSFHLVPRESVEAVATETVLHMREELFDLDVRIPLREQSSRHDWYTRTEDGILKSKLDSEHGTSVKILPKPPKLRIALPERRHFYTSENVVIDVVLTNEEDEEADAVLNVELVGTHDRTPIIQFLSKNELPGERGVRLAHNSFLEDIAVGTLEPGSSTVRTIGFTALSEEAEYKLEITANYHLASDATTPIKATLSEDITVTPPFKVDYEFLPRLQSEPWPSYFRVDEAALEDHELPGQVFKQHWCLEAKITSSSVEDMSIEAVDLKILESKQDTEATLLSRTDGDIDGGEPVIITPKETVLRSFLFEVLRQGIEERHSSVLDMQLDIVWKRQDATPKTIPTTSAFLVPELTVPFGEPRVLASARPSEETNQLIHLRYTIENPSSYFLTFSLAMESSEEFAFSGPKTQKVQLLPLSRHNVDFNLFAFQGEMWIRPILKVVDVGFGKTLRVGAAAGVSPDHPGIQIWIE